MKLKIFSTVIVILIALSYPVNFVFAHGGVDDEPPEPVKAVVTDSGSTKLLTTAKIEVLLKYSELKLKESVPIQVFVTDFKTNKPLSKLDVDLSFKGSGKAIEVNAKPTTTQGLYQTNLNFDTVGTYNLTLDVTGNKINEHLSSNGFEIKGSSLTGQPANIDSWLIPLLEILLGLLSILAIFLFVSVPKKQLGNSI
ncbi:MAG: hypothetical protein H7263_04135 [Candidatus Sericytochromatia bacterium]|nr:hypothetical protein [Candidatus Sericytochromatia bacterium]